MKCFLLLCSLLAILLSSCSIMQRHYMPGYYFDKEPKSIRPVPGEAQVTPIEAVSKSTIAERFKEEPKEILSSIEGNTLTPDSACDVILLKNGSKVEGKVIEVNPGEIKFRKCNYLDGPLIVIPRTKVSAIHYGDGRKDIFKSDRPNNNNRAGEGNSNTGKTDHHKTNQGISSGEGKNISLAVASLVTGIIGIFLLPIIGSVAAVVLGFAALSKITRNPEEYGGKGMAIAGIVLGLLGILVVLAIFILLVNGIGLFI